MVQMANKILTVGILSWNRRDALKIALKSVEKQSVFKKLEVIVLDNNSTDGSPQFVKDNFPWVHLITMEKNI